VNKDARIPEGDWRKKWKLGTYDYLDPEYKPGTHEVERGDVTWHQLRTRRDVQDIAKQDQAPPEESAK